ncbi:TPA: endonuclease V [Candidatus Woesearchaeota archaeon]|nr:hypothetical protein [archaeon]HIJ11453.1 endonuclease V [Candidatus Woesearchaeota archaeon]
MDTFELKREQARLARRIILRDAISTPNTIGAVECIQQGDNLLAAVVVCNYPSMDVVEKKVAILPSPLPYKLGFVGFREMPAIMDAYDMLEEEPDILLVKGLGINHPRRFGVASHIGLSLNVPTIAVNDSLCFGSVENGKIMLHSEIVGFEITTREHSKPIYVSPGHKVSLGTVLNIIPSLIQYPHKMPEPMHIARKVGKKKVKG